MKNKMLSMYRLGLNLETADGGGGTATATPPAPVSAPPPAAQSGSIFGGVTAPVKVELPKGEPKTDWRTTAYAEPLLGRYKTPAETEDGLRRSQEEGLRLHNENRTLQERYRKDLSDRETRLEQMKADLEYARKTPAFQERSEEELKELAKENPLAAQKYLVEKTLRDRDLAAQKEQRDRSIAQRQTNQEQVRRTVTERHNQMKANKEEFPQYEEVQPLVQSLLDKTAVDFGDGERHSPLTGHEWTPEVAYFAAMGKLYVDAMKEGKLTQTDAAATAKAKAEADAAAARGAPKGGGAPLTPKDEDAQYHAAVIAAGKRRVFGR